MIRYAERGAIGAAVISGDSGRHLEHARVAESANVTWLIEFPTFLAQILQARVVPAVDVQGLDDDDKPLRRGQLGEICVRGNLVMPGY